MKFGELNEDNSVMFAIKHYENPQSVTREDFDDDMKRFKYLKRLFKRYLRGGSLRSHLIINHLVILYNVFDDAATPLLFFKLEKEYWPLLKAFLYWMNRYPECWMESLEEDPDIKEILDKI
ncbi:hypothetical protein Syn7803C72_158 [Synechococcus phage ACG-2014d]|jgi:hypothetical protein|uniref:Uncharacterized protein n=1 Tax=Synechococcus phage ACG-2014d TaxID=1493509 RepID=A0A0E3EY16_9CAUD|nr:hypothetical protein AAJ59_gp158 [Synechococcus phage ACG-2014d]YP_010355328.1 hypothetical protein M1M12_gp159 [Synechococcus phage ACG-2014d]AIX14770.1 hypothetical protein Syn7803C45_159 [Synechococcus phage ACG-2014d]AIX14989.1 hypothetical protein Syn7803C46_158 [Synechococcus phage ACG-2014d]AIX15416.1 hypothetical protein Syn7803C48_158 [Synechococcus phage ACG-2014d]AIX15636.1 hypothetical protein Syn7803C49_160 [Synechococcus phage ACG-2014d]AIX16064.1 hypothetical protein Syn7803